jgi:hypothetical protein
MTFGSTETSNPAGADDDKTSVKAAGLACAAGRAAAGAVLSHKHVASSDAAVRMTVMLFGFFIRYPFFIANREKL